MITQDEIYSGLNAVFRDIFMRDDISLTPDTTAADVVGWDSFKQIEIIMAIEEYFKVKMNIREVDSLKNVGDLANVVANKKAK
jgi:acyl carrier protein